MFGGGRGGVVSKCVRFIFSRYLANLKWQVNSTLKSLKYLGLKHTANLPRATWKEISEVQNYILFKVQNVHVKTVLRKLLIQKNRYETQLYLLCSSSLWDTCIAYCYTINTVAFAGDVFEPVVSKYNGMFFVRLAKRRLEITRRRDWERKRGGRERERERDVRYRRADQKEKSWEKLETVYFVEKRFGGETKKRVLVRGISGFAYWSFW